MQAQIQEMNDTATAAMAELEAGIYEAHEAMDDPARDSSALRRANNRMAEAYTILSTLQPTAPQQVPRPTTPQQPRPFSGQGNCLGGDNDDEPSFWTSEGGGR